MRPIVLSAVLLLSACVQHESPAPAAPVSSAAPAAAPAASTEAEPEATSSGAQQPSAQIAAIVAASDRSADDVVLDAGRKPAELLSFFGLKPGMKVADLAAGGGYTTELLARAVGPEGKVYGQNNSFVLKRFAEAPWSARLQKPVMQNVVRVDRESDSPLPPEVHDLDLVLMVLFYHDMVWQKVDRAAMNRAVFTALRPGGIFGIVDHSAAEGAGSSVTESLHRIEESVVVQEVQAAGFELVASESFLREPGDTRDWNASPRAAGDKRGHSDRFVLKFIKPQVQ